MTVVQIIGRAEWGARYNDGCGAAPIPATEAWLHHTATAAPATSASQPEDAAKIRELEDIGQARFGCGISYTWLICPSGRVFQGHSPARQGTHTLNHNTAGRGIALVGNYMTTPPSSAMLASLAGLLQQAAANRWLAHARLDGGHRDAEVAGYTECPGDAAYGVIAQVNQMAGGGVREGIDLSGPYPTAAAMKAAGRDFVVRYARKTGSLDKQITAAEAAYWRANGIDVAIVDEAGAARALDGFAAGAADARSAVAAIKAVGGPADGGKIYMAVDFDASAAQISGPVRAFIEGAASVLGAARTGVYGSYDVVRYMLDNGVCRYAWQTYAWSGGLWDPRAQLRQYLNGQTLGGVAVDYNRATVVDFGQWGGPTEEDLSIVDPATKTYLDGQFAGIVGEVLAGLAGASGSPAREQIAQRSRQVIGGDDNYGLDLLRRKIDAIGGSVASQADDERVLLTKMDALGAEFRTTLAAVQGGQSSSADAVAIVHEAITALTVAVGQMTPGGSLDLDELARKVGDVVANALSGSILTITRQ